MAEDSGAAWPEGPPTGKEMAAEASGAKPVGELDTAAFRSLRSWYERKAGNPKSPRVAELEAAARAELDKCGCDWDTSSDRVSRMFHSGRSKIDDVPLR